MVHTNFPNKSSYGERDIDIGYPSHEHEWIEWNVYAIYKIGQKPNAMAFVEILKWDGMHGI